MRRPTWPMPTMPMVLPALRSHQRVAIDVAVAAQRAVGLDDALRQRQQHAERMSATECGVAAGLVDDQHAGCGAGLDIDGIEARAVAGDDQEVRRAPQQVGMDMEVRRQLVARRPDLVDMRRRENGARSRPGFRFRAGRAARRPRFQESA